MLRLRAWFPWLPEGGELCDPALAEREQLGEREDLPTEDDVDPQVWLGRSMPVAGLLHIIHNAGNSMLASCPELSECVELLKSVCVVLSSNHLRKRLLPTCFRGAVGGLYHHEFDGFSHRVYPA
eukprot:15438273-Alexandrium_andersonii.AAC.1